MAGSGGWEQWEWDESLFAGAAGYYEQGRLPYTPGLADALAHDLGLDGRGRLLDVGCGPGTVARRLAPLFEAVVGLDPDPGMLAEAARLAASEGVVRATWVRERAETLPAGLGAFRVITFGASFHWMDRPRVARAVRTMLTPDGAAVQVDAPGYRADALLMETGHGRLRFPPPPDEAMEGLRRRYLGPDRRAGQGIRNTSPGGEDDVFQAAGFLPARTVVAPGGRSITALIRSSRVSSRTRGPRPISSGIASGSSRATCVRCSLRRLWPAGSPCGCRTTSCTSGGLPDLYAWRMDR
jgi:SAM-dependent methyltransferase